MKDTILFQPENGKFGDYIRYRDMLVNTYKKLTEDKKLTVVYFGGSVTVGYGVENTEATSWRALVGKWLNTTFPDAEVTNLNRGTGESGTYLGSYRFERDVVGANPDLVFIEYSINDYYCSATYEQAASQYEAIVRGIRQQLPECDIVTILVTEKGHLDGQLHIQAQAHEDVSKVYCIPTLHVGRALAMQLLNHADSDEWSNYSIDVVHLNDRGNAFYYAVIEEFMTTCLVECAHPVTEMVKHTVPDQYCDVLHNGNVTVIEPTAQVITRSEQLGGQGFAVVDKSYGVSNYPCYFYSDSANAEIVIEFNGTELVMLNWANGVGEYAMKVDGGEYATKSLKGIHDLALNPTILVTDLPSGEHTMYLRLIKAKDDGFIKIAAFYSRDAAKASRK